MAKLHRLRTAVFTSLLTLVAAGVAAPASVAAPAALDLPATLDQLLTDPRLAGSHLGLHVRDAVTGAELYARDTGDRLIPASNEKLLTSAAAAEVLGLAHRFHTRALAAGERHGPVLRGDLYLKGTGDPTMLAADYDALAASVAASGVRVVVGGLVADDTWFDQVRLGSDWAWDDEPFYYAAQVSALTLAPDTDYDAGSVIVEARPGPAAGAPATLALVPANSYVRLVNRATTGAAGTAETISVVREHGTNTIVVSGSVPLGGAATRDWATVWEPTGYAASVFRDALARHGVLVMGRTTYGATPATAQVVADHASMTLGELFVPFLKLSNNGHAEVLVKSMGRARSNAGTWSAGLAAMSAVLPGLGVNTAVIRTVDGSGLSRRDWLTTQQISNLLVAAQSRPWFPAWYEALPIAGQPDRLVGGTLRARMVGTPAAGNMHAKTGSLTGVNALSGYVTDADGRRLVFSIVANNTLSSAASLLDAIGVALASYSAGGGAAIAARTVETAPALNANGEEVECSWVKAC